METPMSTRRVTRSQTLADSNGSHIPLSRKNDESEKSVLKSWQRNGKQQQDRSALIDITNDSPIVGLAMGSLATPSSGVSKRKSTTRAARQGGTPGSGEALLRDQVKNLLQKVEEEAEISKFAGDHVGPFQGLVNSPMTLFAPTPTNTPQILNQSADSAGKCNGSDSLSPSPVEDKFTTIQISQLVAEIFEGKKQEDLEGGKNLITRSLLFDYSEKSESPESSECSSVICQGQIECKESSMAADDDDSSIWSIQVNASTRDDDEDDDDDGDGILEDEDGSGSDCEGEEERNVDDLVDDLCEGMARINVKGGMAEFKGKHTRFIYDSEGEEIVGEECGEETPAAAGFPSVVRLKGWPMPEGKHIRFPEAGCSMID